MTVTIFSWGYYGWGNHTSKWVEAVDAVEVNRGYNLPIFVDIRIQRSVRAHGFQGSTFEKLLGPSRHRWMKSLGNSFIQTRTGPAIQIADPSAANELLDLALESVGHKRRIIFFCSCQWPRHDGKVSCHRSAVAGLLLNAAKKRSQRVEIVEWPGGQPDSIDLTVEPALLAAIRKGRTTVPLGKQIDLAKIAALPWCSIATLRAGGDALYRIVGPSFWQKGQWALPILTHSCKSDIDLLECQKEAAKLRCSLGLEPTLT